MNDLRHLGHFVASLQAMAFANRGVKRLLSFPAFTTRVSCFSTSLNCISCFFSRGGLAGDAQAEWEAKAIFKEMLPHLQSGQFSNAICLHNVAIEIMELCTLCPLYSTKFMSHSHPTSLAPTSDVSQPYFLRTLVEQMSSFPLEPVGTLRHVVNAGVYEHRSHSCWVGRGPESQWWGRCELQ